ncbi:MAG TPA: SPOR domain-containing protein [Thermoanaerobaculia bacterium]|nr:SPOR domain-containing protein [Thermoanaerobaculia bacterium]
MRHAIRFAVLALLVANAFAATPAQPRDEEIRLLEYVLDDAVLSDSVAGYAGPGNGTLLPLGISSELIGVGITVDLERGTARGFVLNEKTTFQLDVARGSVTVAGKPRRFDRELVRVYGDDIYVDSTLLGEWLPVAFDVELFALRVRVRPREQLPMQTRLDRERRIRHWRLRLAPEDPDYPSLSTKYRLYDTPSIDQTVRLSLGQEQLHGSYATYATGDLFYMESEAYASGDDRDPFDDWRLTLRRRDAAGKIAGALRATEVAVGHIFHPTSTLLSMSTEAAPGVLVSNLPLYRATEFERHSFRGNLPPGWDVELYHNGTLVDYRQTRADGQYSFEDVPILFGMNFFRLVFYGPQGQRREEEHRFLLGDSLTKPGRLEYRLAASAASMDEYRGSLFLSYGISRHVTATGELAVLPTPAGERVYGKGGARMFWSALFAYGDYVVDDTGGSAYEAGMQTRILGVNLAASRTSVRDGYVSDALHAIGDPIVTRDRVRIDTAIPASILPRFPISAELERQQLASGVVRTVVQGRVSASYKGLSISNRLLRTTLTGQPVQTEGGLQFSRHLRRTGVRGEVLYGIEAGRVSSANLSVERPIAAGYRVYAGVARSFLDSRHVFAIGIDKSAGSFAAGVETRFTTGGDSLANINLSAGIGRDPLLGAWMASARSRAGSGALSVRVFLDRNRNDVFDAGDQPLEGVAFTVNSVERAERTGRDGVAYLAELSPHAPADVAVDMRTLEDPQWDPAIAGVRVMPRPGKAATLDVAVIATTEIEGTVTRLRGHKTDGAAAMTVQLVNAAGKVVQQTKTSYDGYYLISKVRPGRYTVRIAGASPDVPSREIAVRTDESLVAGVDFRLIAPPARAVLVANVEAAPAESAAREGRFIVQLGAFGVRANAEALLRRAGADRARIDHRGKLYFVEAGPFPTHAHAVTARAALARQGFSGIVRP